MKDRYKYLFPNRRDRVTAVETIVSGGGGDDGDGSSFDESSDYNWTGAHDFLHGVMQDGENLIRLNNAGSGNYNATLVGRNAGTDNIHLQTAVGAHAGANMVGTNQIALGGLAGYENDSSNQLAVGYMAGRFNSGDDQTAIGREAGRNNTAAKQTAVGLEAGKDNTGRNSTSIGSNAGQNNSGRGQSVLGISAGQNNSGSNQIALGAYAGYENNSTNQLAVGYLAGQYNSGDNQTAIGREAGRHNTATKQTAVGLEAGKDNTGPNSTSIGSHAGQNNSGANQSVLGIHAGKDNSGEFQVALGRYAGGLNTGDAQTAIGYLAGYSNNADHVISIGDLAGYSNNADHVISIGTLAGRDNSGQNSVFIGYESGRDNTENNTFLLHQSSVSNSPLIKGYFATGEILLDGDLSMAGQTVIDDAQNFFGDTADFNKLLLTDLAESKNGYVSGIMGAGTRWDMDTTGGSFFEVDNMRVRNELRAHIFKKDIVKASNAYLFITDAAEIAEEATIVDTTDTFRIVNDGTNASFSEDDLLWAKNIQDDGSLDITGVKITVGAPPTGGYATGTTNDKNWTEYTIKAVENGGALNAGDTIVRVSGGNILNDASSQYAPFIDIYDGVSTWAEFHATDKTKVRLGNLEGVSNTNGYGLFTKNAFLTGSLLVGDLTKSDNYLEYDGVSGSLNAILSEIDVTIDVDNKIFADNTGVEIKATNFDLQGGDDYWRTANNGDFSFAGGALSGDGSSVSISGADASINVNDFQLQATSASSKIELGNDSNQEPLISLSGDGSGYFAGNTISWDSTGDAQIVNTLSMGSPTTVAIGSQASVPDINTYGTDLTHAELNITYDSSQPAIKETSTASKITEKENITVVVLYDFSVNYWSENVIDKATVELIGDPGTSNEKVIAINTYDNSFPTSVPNEYIIGNTLDFSELAVRLRAFVPSSFSQPSTDISISAENIILRQQSSSIALNSDGLYQRIDENRVAPYGTGSSGSTLTFQGGSISEWSDIENKPFEAVSGSNLTTSGDQLDLKNDIGINSVSASDGSFDGLSVGVDGTTTGEILFQSEDTGLPRLRMRGFGLDDDPAIYTVSGSNQTLEIDNFGDGRFDVNIGGNVSASNLNTGNWNTAYTRSVTGVSGDGNSTLTIQRQGSNTTTNLAHSHGYEDLPMTSTQASGWDTAYDRSPTDFLFVDGQLTLQQEVGSLAVNLDDRYATLGGDANFSSLAIGKSTADHQLDIYKDSGTGADEEIKLSQKHSTGSNIYSLYVAPRSLTYAIDNDSTSTDFTIATKERGTGSFNTGAGNINLSPHGDVNITSGLNTEGVAKFNGDYLYSHSDIIIGEDTLASADPSYIRDNLPNIHMGWLTGLPQYDQDGAPTGDLYDSNQYGIWLRPGDQVVVDGEYRQKGGSWILEEDSAVKIVSGVTGNDLIRMGRQSTLGRGLFFYDGDGNANSNVVLQLVNDKFELRKDFRIDSDSGDYWEFNSGFQFGGSSGIKYSGTGSVEIGSNTTIKGDLDAAGGTFSGNLSAVGGSFSGDLDAAGGTFSGNLSAVGGSFSGDLDAAGGTFSGNLSAVGGSFSGDLDAAGGTFSGNLSAVGGSFSGDLDAAGGSFSGDISAASGTFSGSIEASSGEIGGWDIGGSGGRYIRKGIVNEGHMHVSSQIWSSHRLVGAGVFFPQSTINVGDIRSAHVGQLHITDTVDASNDYGFEIIEKTGSSSVKHLVRMGAGDFFLTNASNSFKVDKQGFSVSTSSMMVRDSAYTIEDSTNSIVGSLWGTTGTVHLQAEGGANLSIRANDGGDVRLSTIGGGNHQLVGLATSDPNVNGALWKDLNGYLRVSSG